MPPPRNRQAGTLPEIDWYLTTIGPDGNGSCSQHDAPQHEAYVRPRQPRTTPMSLLRNQTALSFAILATVCVVGCRPEADNTQWEAAQQRTEGQTAQESSRDRLAPSVREVSPDSTDTDELGPPPAFNPGGPSTSGEVKWRPSGLTDEEQSEVAIDIESLKTGDPVDGSRLNQYFPAQQTGEDRVAKQEKKGFAQYSFRRDGVEVAQLSITDLRSNPAAAEKFRKPDMQIAGYPATQDGSHGTTLLVGGRFQVKVRSPDGQLDGAQRSAMLQRFDLAKLEKLAI